VLALLSRASPIELADGLARLTGVPTQVDLRPPEAGMVLVRARIGGDGAPFNLGEAMVSRAAVRLGTGEVGISYRLGRDPAAARAAALLDALWQRSEWTARVEEAVLTRVRRRLDNEARARAEAAAATSVEFFTVARGGD
jgi:alpha-D-ribose 1-methylphosphonate 5-triphosphate synthase subunit PhnG